jgi:uncharacterized membrane protein YqjE
MEKTERGEVRPMRRILTGFIDCLTVVQLLALFFALAQPAYAYVDPGSGLLALQVIGSAFAGIIFIVRRRLKSLLRITSMRFESKREAREKP